MSAGNTKLFSAYSFPALALAPLGITFYVYLPKFYSDNYGIPLGALGIIIILSRIWDSIIDPTIGQLSDRTKSKLGRRKSWILFSTIPLVLTFYLLMVPPQNLSDNEKLVFLTVTTFIFFLSWSTLMVPYEALGTEIVSNYDERTSLYTWRQAFMIVGTLIASILPFVLKDLEIIKSQNIIGITYCILLIASTLWLIYVIKEKTTSFQKYDNISILSGIKAASKNKPFMVLLFSYTVTGLGSALPATLITFYVEYVLGSKDASLYLLLYFAVGLLCLPIWVIASKKFEKKFAWLFALAINTFAFTGVLFLGKGDLFWYGVIVCISAIGYGGTLAIPASMQADVLDLEQFERGNRREGEFLGIWSTCNKLTQALGAGIAFPILHYFGYTPNQEQIPTAIYALTWLYAGIPSLCNVLGIMVGFQYTLTRKKIENIQYELSRVTKNNNSNNNVLSNSFMDSPS